MSQLIIGDVTENSAKIWVRGIANNESTTTLTAQVTLKSDLLNITQNLSIYKHDYFIGVLELTDLNPADSGFIRMLYTVEITFKDIARVPIGFPARGSFNTSPRFKPDVRFLHGCNFIQTNENDGKRVFKNLTAIRKKEKSQLMIHGGNQIYVDAPAPKQAIQSESYTTKYLQAWKSREAAEFLGRIANYSAINDHELYFRYANDVEYDYKPATYYLREALPSYQLFQQARNPNSYGENKLYYNFTCGEHAFFVLDTRTERYQFVKSNQKRQMIGEQQMEALKSWLLEHKNNLKFIHSAVPFVTIKETDYSEYWSSEAFIDQKNELLQFIKENDIHHIIFLTGQANATLHSTLKLKKSNREIVIHELMTGPLNMYEIGISNYDDFIWRQRTITNQLDYEYHIQVANAELAPNVMSIHVDDKEVVFKSYSTKYDLEEDEIPQVILSGSIPITKE